MGRKKEGGGKGYLRVIRVKVEICMVQFAIERKKIDMEKTVVGKNK